MNDDRYPAGLNVQPCFDGPKSWVNLEDMEIDPGSALLGRLGRGFEMDTIAARALGEQLIAAAEKADGWSEQWIARQAAS